MEEKKLTDEEIVKALELCVKNDCEKCPYLIKGFDCVISKQAENDFLDLIHRLQDENRALLKENEELTISYFGVQNQARIRCEELQKQVDELSQANIDLWNANQLGVKYSKNPYKGVEVE